MQNISILILCRDFFWEPASTQQMCDPWFSVCMTTIFSRDLGRGASSSFLLVSSVLHDLVKSQTQWNLMRIKESLICDDLAEPEGAAAAHPDPGTRSALSTAISFHFLHRVRHRTLRGRASGCGFIDYVSVTTARDRHTFPILKSWHVTCSAARFWQLAFRIKKHIHWLNIIYCYHKHILSQKWGSKVGRNKHLCVREIHLRL